LILSTAIEGFVPGLGYGNAQVFKTLTSQKEGVWGGVVKGDVGAVVLKILRKTVPAEAQLAASAAEDQTNSWRFGAMSGFNEYLANLEASAEIVNNMDLYYRD